MANQNLSNAKSTKNDECFKQIVAEGIYSLPKESDITIILHVESPDNLQFEIRKNGELIDELILTGI